MNRKPRLLVTGGFGLVGGLLVRGLRELGYRVEVFDRYRGVVVGLLRRRWLATTEDPRTAERSARLNRMLASWEKCLAGAGVVRASGDDIGWPLERLRERFRGIDCVIHLAGIPHPGVPGFSDADYTRINYDASLRIHRAACEAGVPRFLFASSMGVYGFSCGIAGGARFAQFPIIETNHRPTGRGENTTYGRLKTLLEDALAEAGTANRNTASVAVRLGGPGFRILYPLYLGMSTSIDNLVEGFDALLRSEWHASYDAFNLCDAERDPGNLVDPYPIINFMWPDVPNHMSGRQSAFSPQKLIERMGYRPVPRGRYLHARVTGESAPVIGVRPDEFAGSRPSP